MLTVTHIVKKFDDIAAVNDVSFSIAPGEIFSLIGPNSSGKTTIVKSIAGLLQVNGGTIWVDGHDVAVSPKEAKAVIGYIPDEPSVWGSMTGEEFLHFVGALYGMSPSQRVAKINELLPLFSVTGTEKDQFQNYSRGNKQKFSILAALLHEPKLLLVDEPIVGLDPESAAIAKKLFREFAKRGGAVLLVTHTLPVAEEISTRIGVLKDGALLSVGTFDELRERAQGEVGATLEQVYTALTKVR
ncbi:MAG: hypothetical protein A2845_01665 [Candidatus Lloydbacteria bacterium RIFCSPHIGHO2_01_FULL_49_22]|uniref:ABC transporter domain-containing protein n=1 Tax=Candidatus Lloydbacteria bacterium RIFCSPHIGHO2_01_FULL_49_22 TaxID=1798658 RepID=A0A1G2CXN1_9BACT|nr:MAG: hypothetical protein A2845_01665 [Candidatus Lloydbacteria bacterium RIFCSPHIGHO2_01_FULL_49_22]OGZ10005.1 MAG: hypothetical protein A3C14_04830 [Candidatus Lloydbacteria bacterium RIFCSPHIGHO2_02_FULL_50_18]